VIVGLTGYARAGKDTVGDILVEHHGFQRASFADALKKLAVEVNPIIGYDLQNIPIHLAQAVARHGMDVVKVRYPHARVFLQNLGIACRRMFGNDVLVDPIREAIGRSINLQWKPGHEPSWGVTDVRFFNEVKAIEDLGGTVYRVERPHTGPANGHVSEHELAGVQFPVIANDGTLEDLVDTVSAALELPLVPKVA
jgi:hypothetical protein